MSSIAAFKGRGTNTLPGMVEAFLRDLEAQNKSPHTLKSYRLDMGDFLRYYQGGVDGISAAMLRAYFEGLVESLSPASQARKRATLKSFFRWCYQQEILPSNPMDKLGAVKVPEAQPRFLAAGQVERILKAISNDRDRVLFTLISETGLRISEALSVRVEDLRLEAQELRVRGKGQKERTVHLVKTESLRLLTRFLRKHGIKEGLVFRPDPAKQRRGVANRPIDYSVVSRAWKRYCEDAGVSCTIHQLRHTYATDLINRGVPVEIVGKILGHKNIQTTTRYAKVSEQTVRKALEHVR